MELNFDEFPIPSAEEWHQAAIETLKGAPFDKVLTTRTYEGVTLQPIYTQTEINNLQQPHTLPGFSPFVRGTHAQNYMIERWQIAQHSTESTPKAVNAALLHNLAHGQTAIHIMTDIATRNGLDPDQAKRSDVGQQGVSIATQHDLATMFSGIDLGIVHWAFSTGHAIKPLAALVISHLQQNNQLSPMVNGCLAADPLGQLATEGTLLQPLETYYDDLAEIMGWAEQKALNWHTLEISTVPYHAGGCNAVQELAIALATGVTYLETLLKRGLSISTIAQHLRFTVMVGPNFFMEVAKIRALRMLWAQVIAAFNGQETDQQTSINAITSSINKTAINPHMNILRTTTEALAAVVGGCDGITITPFDNLIALSSEFSERVARNQQIILQEECNLTGITDPAGGAWYIEYLTDWLAQAAWQQFQTIESEGGLLAALHSGFIHNMIKEITQQRTQNIGRRKDVLVGVNMYANVNDKITPRPSPDIDVERMAEITAQRAIMPAPAQRASLTQLIEAAQSGATISQLQQMAHPTTGTGPTIIPIAPYRAAQIFEDLRAAVSDHTAKNGQPPHIFLANMGPVRQHSARADFTTSFFESGGFHIISSPGFTTVEAAADAALASHAEAVVICSTDETYPDIVPPLVAHIKQAQPQTIVILAGYPADQIEAHRAAGIDEFIYIRANCYEINASLLRQIGVLPNDH